MEETLRFFWANVDQDGPLPEHRPELGRCMLWTRSPSRGGYGQLWTGERRASVHVFSYEVHIGAVPPGQQIDHLCHHPDYCPAGPCAHRLCVNPQHMEPVPGDINRKRGHLERPGNGG